MFEVTMFSRAELDAMDECDNSRKYVLLAATEESMLKLLLKILRERKATGESLVFTASMEMFLDCINLKLLHVIDIYSVLISRQTHFQQIPTNVFSIIFQY